MREGKRRECVHFKCNRSLFPHIPYKIFSSKYLPANPRIPSSANSLNLKLPLPSNALNESGFTVNAWIEEDRKCPFLGCEIAPSLGVVHFKSADWSVLSGSAPSLERIRDGRASRSCRTPIPRERPSRCSGFRLQGTPPASNSSPGSIFQSPNLGAGRGEVGGGG